VAAPKMAQINPPNIAQGDYHNYLVPGFAIPG